MRTHIASFALAVLLACGVAAAAEQSDTLAMLPLENLSGADEATAELSRSVSAAVQNHGWHIADPEVVESVLRENRVRYLDSLEDGTRTVLLEKSGASAVLSGEIFLYQGGRNPAVAVSLSLTYADGSEGWSNVVGLAASDTEKAFGFGRVSSVGDVGRIAVERLLEGFPRPNVAPKKAHDALPLFRRAAAAYKASDGTAVRRVCILPLENDSSNFDASRVVTALLASRLESVGYEVVDPAELRKAALDTRVGSLRSVDKAGLQKLGDALETTLFVNGTIYEYPVVDTSGQGKPLRLDLELSLMDVSTGQVIWAAQHDRAASDYIGLLMLGEISNSVALSERVLDEIVASIRPTDSPSAKTTAAGPKRTPSRRASLRASSTDAAAHRGERE